MSTSWQITTLGSVAFIERDGVAPEAIDDGTNYLGLEHIASGGEVQGPQLVKCGDLASQKFRFDRGHVLYGKLRPYLGKITIPEFSGVCSTDILPIRPGPRIDQRFLLHFLRQPSQVERVSGLATGANLPRINPKALEGLEIPLPSIEEQRRIVAVLDAADALRAKRRQAIAKLDTLTQSIFIDMFGDPVSNPLGWPMMSLADLGELDRGVSKHRPRNDPKILGGRWPLIQTGDVAGSGGYITAFGATYSDFGLSQSKLWPAGTLCVTIAANIAKTGILTFDACFPDSVVGFTGPNSITNEYVRFFLRFLQPALERQAPESAQKNINLKVLRGLRVPAPPADLLAAFGRALTLANEMLEASATQQGGLDSLFASLQQRAFRGEL